MSKAKKVQEAQLQEQTNKNPISSQWLRNEMGTNLKESFKNEKIERLRDHITGYLDYKDEEVVNYR